MATIQPIPPGREVTPRQLQTRPAASTFALLFAFAMVLAADLNGQIGPWGNPKVDVTLRHPPGLGLNIKRIAFVPTSDECSEQAIDLLTEQLVLGGIEVLDRRNLDAILTEHRFSFSGNVDRNRAAELGKILGPTALVIVKIPRCATERTPLYGGTITRTMIARTRVYVRGSFQVVDLTTGKIFATYPVEHSPMRENRSKSGMPEFPSEFDLKDQALRFVAFEARKLFVPWSETKRLTFFDDKDCNLKAAFQLLKGGDIDGALTQSGQNLEACKGADQKALAHAHYNLGLLHMITESYPEAHASLSEASRLNGGDVVTETMGELRRSEALKAQLRRVEERSLEFGPARPSQAPTAPAPDTARIPANSTGSSIEERLRTLNNAFSQGLISKEDYEQKKAQILKEM